MEGRVDDISFTFLEVEEDFDGEDVLLGASIYLSSYYLANKRSFYVRSQGLEISTLIGEKKITYHCHYEKISLKYPYA